MWGVGTCRGDGERRILGLKTAPEGGTMFGNEMGGTRKMVSRYYDFMLIRNLDFYLKS